MKNKFSKIIVALAFLVFVTSCEKMILEPNPSDDNLSVFDEYWKLVNKKYAMLKFKNVDWQNGQGNQCVRKSIMRCRKKPLFEVLGDMATLLHDAHSWVHSGDSIRGWDDLYAGYEQNLHLEILQEYLKDTKVINESPIFYKKMDNNIGYIWIQAFEDFEAEDVETIVSELKDTKGINH